MGTNYYGHRIPNAEEKQKLAQFGAEGNVGALRRLLEEFDEIHIGKSSGGWQFLFNMNGGRFYNSKAQLIEWLHKVDITDEYGRSITAEEFWDTVVSNRMWGGKPAKKHSSDTSDTSRYINIDGLEFLDSEFS